MEIILYNSFIQNLMEGKLNLTSDTLKMILLNNEYIPDLTTDLVYSDISQYEMTGMGYTVGGKVITNPTITFDSELGKTFFKIDNTVWEESIIIGARYAVIYKNTGDASTSLLIGYFNFGVDMSSSNGVFEIKHDVNGILSIKH